MAKAKKIVKEAAGFLPGVGTAMDVASAGQAIASGNLPLAALETASAAVGLVPGVGRVLGKALKFGAKKTGLVKFTKEDILTKNNANYKAIRGNVDEKLDKKTAEELFEADEDYVKSIQKAQSKARKMDDPGKRPFQKEALELQEGKITPKEYREVAFADVEKFDEVEELPTFTESIFALDKNKRAKGMIGLDKTIPKGKPKIEAGDKVMARLDIPAYNRFDVYVPQITYKKPDGKGAESIFSRTMVIQDVKFPTPTKPSFDIARGVEQKFPHATINGTVAKNPLTKKMFTDEEAHSVAKAVIDDDDFMHLGYNPDRGGFFYDRGTKMPVFNSPFVVQIGKQIFAKKPIETGAERIAKMRKMDLREIKDPKTKEPLVQGRPVLFNKGGATMQEQMKFAFMNEGGVLADDGINRDPVSGNEVPSGSMAKEVRDDVPAMLSEGEYVVPADVVRFHGIDKFEQLRDEAKAGLARMEADGRIGGQPVEEQEEFPFPVEELQGFDEGGAVGDTYSDVMGSDFRANQRYGSLPTMGFELRNFTNPKTGETVVVPFFNGKPMQYIPPDFLESGASTTGGGVSGSVGDDGGRQETAPRDTGMSDLAYDAASKALRGTKTVPQTKPFSEYSTEDFRRYVQTRQGVLGRVMDAIPVVGMLTSMQDNAAREFARRSLIQGRNIATGQPLTNNDAGVLMQVADLPKGRSVLSAIDDFLQGKTGRADGIVIDDTPPIDTELRRTTYEAEKPIGDTPPATTDATKEKVDTSVTEQDLEPAQYFGPSGEFQNIIEPQTVAEEAKGIIDYAWVVVPGVNLNKKFRIDKKNLHLVGASPNDSARAILATDKHGMFDPVLRKTTGKGNLIQVHSEGPENAKVLSKEELARYSGANVNADASEVQGIIESNNNKIDKNKKGIIQSIRNALDMSAGAATPTRDSILTSTSGERVTVGGVPIYNNPGNIEEGQGYAGTIGAYNTERRKDGRKAFVEFDSPQMGIRALTIDLKTKANRYNGDVEQMFLDYLGGGREGTIEQRYQRAAKDNNNIQTVKNYINNIKNKLGSDTLDVNNVDALTTTIKTVIQNENKKPVIDYYNTGNVIREGVVLAGKSFDKSVKLADARKAMSGELFQAGLARVPPKSPFETGQAVAQPTEVAQPQDVSQFYGQRFDPTQIDTDDMLRQAAQNIPAGSDVGGATPEYFGPPGFQNIIAPQVTRQSTLPFVQGPPVAPTVGSPAVSPATAQDTQMQQAFSIPRRDVAGTTTAPTIGGTGLSGTLPQVDTTTPVSRTTPPLIQDFAPMGDRKITDAREFLETRKAAQQAVDEALSFAPKTKPKEKEISDAEYKRNVKEATDKVYDDARKRGDQARDEVLRQGGSVEEAYDAMHTAFTGFDRAGNMVSTDPGTQAMDSVPTFGAFKEGGLASKPKKTKPKKRNTKKGLGGKMAT